ncbi:SEC-C metal-binding domain-containing protein [Enterobacter sp.]|uniref:SEC-C metal-binding domain-containing protein n=1 Tax=Enterobacter sp. TaxID=42895 RepID=UPI00296FC5D3|nr:SEC-C metal-binding domain-containing protein [Enterobacter sp.]
MAKIDPNELCPCESGLLFKECHEPRIKRPEVPKIKETITLNVIPEPDPDARGVIIYQGEGTVAFTGYEVGLALLCGECNSPLVVGVPKDNINNIVIRCNACGAYNEV